MSDHDALDTPRSPGLPGTAAAPGGPDPVTHHVSALGAALDGPDHLKSRMLEEVRDGLTETVDAHRARGAAEDEAYALAVREFGTPAELAPAFQQELTLARTRHAARAAVPAAVLAAACCALVRHADTAAWQLPLPALLLLVLLPAVAAIAAVLTAGSLAVTGRLARRLPVPVTRRLPLAVAWGGTTTGISAAVAAAALGVLAATVSAWPLALTAVGLALAAHATVAAPARACRLCARLPVR